MAILFQASHQVLLTVGLALFGLACVQDWALRSVSNGVPAAILSAGILLRVVENNILSGLLASGAIFIVAFCCWRRGWLGGADVKLFAAGGLLVPPDTALGFIGASCVAGGALALLYMLLGFVVPPPTPTRPRLRLGRYVRLEQRRLRRRGPLPYATAIAAGACFAVCGG